MGERPESGRRSREPIAARAGLAPMNRGRGTWSGTRAVCGGRSHVPSALDRAALSATRGNPALREFARRRAETGKAAKVIRVAVAGKLLVLADAIPRSQQPWEDRAAKASWPLDKQHSHSPGGEAPATLSRKGRGQEKDPPHTSP